MIDQQTTPHSQASQPQPQAPKSQTTSPVDPQAPVQQQAEQALQSVGALYSTLDGALQRQMNDSPYVALAAAAGLGFVLGGGLRSPVGLVLMRMSVRAFGPQLMNATLAGVLERVGIQPQQP